jgi:hypothetical protein
VQTLVDAYQALTSEDVAATLRFLRARHGASFLSGLTVPQEPTG